MSQIYIKQKWNFKNWIYLFFQGFGIDTKLRQSPVHMHCNITNRYKVKGWGGCQKYQFIDFSVTISNGYQEAVFLVRPDTRSYPGSSLPIVLPYTSCLAKKDLAPHPTKTYGPWWDCWRGVERENGHERQSKVT